MVSITKISSKGQIVIPSEIREKMNLEEGNLLIVLETGEDSICLKKVELPKIKSWKESVKPFREAVKKSNFNKDDLSQLIEESRKRD